MKPFEFYFDGKPNSDGTVNAGIKMMSGDPVEIALCLGTYASNALKELKEPQAAIIVLNAFKKFMELNPDITPQVLKALEFNDGARIIRPGGLNSIPPFHKS
jgi:hypothetical protein